MKGEKVHDGIRYTLSNEGLEVGDKVYPVARGRQTDKDGWIIHNYDFRDFMSGFPVEPHTVKSIDIHPLREGASFREVILYTDHGYSHYECYYKVIKREKQVETTPAGHLFKSWEWIEITEDEPTPITEDTSPTTHRYIRHDSGRTDNEAILNTLNLMASTAGTTTDEKGLKVINGCQLMYSDGMPYLQIMEIDAYLKEHGYSPVNVLIPANINQTPNPNACFAIKCERVQFPVVNEHSVMVGLVKLCDSK